MQPDIADTAPTSPVRRCAECRRSIDDLRADARFCSDGCRKRLARRARSIARAGLTELEVAPPADVVQLVLDAFPGTRVEERHR
jgi:hypothetical protein